MKDIVLSIKSTQEVEGQADTTEFMSVGKYSEIDGAVKLVYDESVSIGMDGVKTTLTVSKDGVVSLERSGEYYGNLVVEEGKRHLCQYSTQFGDITIGIFGDKILNELSPCGGKISMQYSIDINSGLLSRNKVEISILEEKPDVSYC